VALRPYTTALSVDHKDLSYLDEQNTVGHNKPDLTCRMSIEYM